jgi:dipeptidase E
MAALPCVTEHFDIFRPPTLDFADYLEGMDIVFVDGGSPRNLIALWKAWGFDGALAQAWKSGVVMSGSSAGALCWFESGLSDSYPKVLSAVHCLGLLPGSADVHHHSRPDRATRFRRLIADGSLKSPGLALDEAVAVLYRGEKRIELVSAKKDAGAWLVTRTPSGYDEVSLPVRYLGPALTTYKQRRQSVPVNR